MRQLSKAAPFAHGEAWLAGASLAPGSKRQTCPQEAEQLLKKAWLPIEKAWLPLPSRSFAEPSRGFQVAPLLPLCIRKSTPDRPESELMRQSGRFFVQGECSIHHTSWTIPTNRTLNATNPQLGWRVTLSDILQVIVHNSPWCGWKDRPGAGAILTTHEPTISEVEAEAAANHHARLPTLCITHIRQPAYLNLPACRQVSRQPGSPSNTSIFENRDILCRPQR
jgi:hypothetical protein